MLAAHDPWTRTDTAFQAACVAADLIDWHQTRVLVSRPGLWEENPILGRHPSVQAVDRYFAESIVLGAAVSYLLPARYRRLHQVFILSLEGICIRRNVKLGISIRF
jgi:hypothetical protein